jgi:tetratricopeptide (TPR) repeat protein
MIDAGRLDEAAAQLSGAEQNADTLYLTGRLWAKRAVTAPLPTPPPAGGPLPRGASLPPAPEFKPEELQAISYYEKAVAARPDHAAAHVGLAELLAPHALRRMAVDKPAAEAGGKRRGRKAAPPPPPALPDTGGVDVSVDRVISAYQFALQADPASATLPEALIGFSLQAGRVDTAEAGHKELLKRQREKPEPFIRYGDFLLNHKQDQEGAIEQYRQALIWRTDDDATRGKIADIFLTRGIDRFNHQQFAAADQEFTQAGKWITDRSSPQAQRLADYQNRLREIRVR